MRSPTAAEKRDYVVNHLDEAIARGEIRAYSQPIVRVITGQVCEVEVLARWESEAFGFLRPDEFVPTLERSRLVHKLDLEVLRLTCAQWNEARELGINVPFGVNFSRLDFELCDVFSCVTKTLARYDVPCEQVHIEVTESAFAHEENAVSDGVRRFREAGFSVYMDDFGSGYSSLGALSSLPVDVVKVDKTLVDHVETNERARAVLAETVSMVKRLGMQTLCEGVETAEQLMFLRAIGCEKAQGFYFSKPVSHEHIMETLHERALANEAAEMNAYLDAVGKVSLLDGTSANINGIEASPLLGHTPIAVLDFSEHGIKLLTSNFAYQRLLGRMGFDSLEDFVAFTSAGTGSINARAMRAASVAKQTGRPQQFDFIVSGVYCSTSLQLVAQAPGHDAYLTIVTSVDNAPQVTEHALLVGLLESGGLNYFWKDSERRFLGANRAFLDYYGFSSLADIMGKTDEDMGWMHGTDDELYRNDELRVLKGETIDQVPGVCLCQGELRDIVTTKRPLYSNGAIVGLVGFFHDLGPHQKDANG